MATGFKTYNAAIGVDVDGNPVKNVLEAAEAKGKSTGVITSVPFSHATPAGFVAHNINRDDYGGIAREMINLSAADVIMGAGNPWYDDNGALMVSPNYSYIDAATWDALVAGTAGNDADGDGDFDIRSPSVAAGEDALKVIRSAERVGAHPAVERVMIRSSQRRS